MLQCRTGRHSAAQRSQRLSSERRLYTVSMAILCAPSPLVVALLCVLSSPRNTLCNRPVKETTRTLADVAV